MRDQAGAFMLWGLAAGFGVCLVVFICAIIWSRVWFNKKLKYLKSVKSEFSSEN